MDRLLAFFGGAAAASAVLLAWLAAREKRFSEADQAKRAGCARQRSDRRVLNIDSYFRAEQLKGKRVLLVGATQGLGLALAKQIVASGAELVATARSESSELDSLRCHVVKGVDTTSGKFNAERLVAGVGANKPIDIVITNAGYFYGPVETLESINFEEQWKQIDICAIGSLRVVAAIANAGLLAEGAKIALITSQAGSIAWRQIQNPQGDNYGHHMSRACTNMMGVLLSFELKRKGVSVALLHPGFNKTSMTSKYAAIYEQHGAVDPSIGAKRVLHEINQLSLENTGRFINCEDGLEIPW